MGGATAQQYGCQPATPSATLPPPYSGVVGKPAGLAGCQLSNVSPCPLISLVSPTAMWASMVRGGVCSSLEEPACPTPQPAVSTADFSAPYERCQASGLKARMVFSHSSGLQIITVSSSLPTATTTAATAGKCRHRQRRGHAAMTVGASTDRSPSTVVAAQPLPPQLA